MALMIALERTFIKKDFIKKQKQNKNRITYPQDQRIQYAFICFFSVEAAMVPTEKYIQIEVNSGFVFYLPT